MSGTVETGKSPMNGVKWLFAIVFLAAAVFGNYYYADVGLLYRVLGVIALIVVGLGVALTTIQGQSFLVLLKEANIERRKVVWPTRQETFRTTLIVVVAVLIVGVILWLIDSGLSWAIKTLIG